ncbi:MAG TPA: DinB family protein [Pyrinomonadaceae bacterium]
MHEEIKEFLISLGRTPVDIALLLTEIPTASLTVRQAVEEFSILESVCHLRDIETEGYSIRINRILNEDNPFLSDLDGSRLAIERDYNRQSLNEAIVSFTVARKQNLVVLNAATEEQFAREGELEGVGVVSLAKLVEMMCDHDEGHIEEMQRLSRLLRNRT